MSDTTTLHPVAVRARQLTGRAAILAVAVALSIPVLVIVWSIVRPSTDVWH